MKAALEIKGNFGGYPHEVRKMVVHQIINQQDETLIDLEPENELYWDWQELLDNPPEDELLK